MGPFEIAVILAGLAIAFLGWLALVMFRRIGRLLLRVERLERSLGVADGLIAPAAPDTAPIAPCTTGDASPSAPASVPTTEQADTIASPAAVVESPQEHPAPPSGFPPDTSLPDFELPGSMPAGVAAGAPHPPGADHTEVMGSAANHDAPDSTAESDPCDAVATSPGTRAEPLAPLADAVLLALSAPADLTRESLHRLLRPLRSPDLSPRHHEAALTAFVAALYSRPDLAGSATVARLHATLDGPPLAPVTDRRLGQVLGFLSGTPAAGHAAAMILDLLDRPNIPPAASDTSDGSAAQLSGATTDGTRTGALLTAAEEMLTWDRDAFDVDRLVRVATGAHLAPFRTRLLHGLLESALLAHPAAVTVEHLDVLAGSYADDPGFGPLLAYLASQQETAPDVRAVALAGLPARLPMRAEVAARLGRTGARVLIVQNIADGQADEIVRVVPLLQALLAVNADLHVTLITARPYLYGNVRLTLVPFDEPAQVAAVFADQFDAVIDFFEDTGVSPSHDASVEELVRQDRKQRQPFLFVGAKKGEGMFVFRHVEVRGRPYAETLGLDRPRVASSYEPGYRLAAHLSLPVRLGQDAPGDSAVLAALPSQTAASAWAVLQARNTEARPVALFAAFGDERPDGGFLPASFTDLARRLHGLIAEGYFVALLPNGQPWGNEAIAGEVLEHLDPADRAHVALGPDPADYQQRVACEGLGDQLVPRACRDLRTTLTWVQYADLIVGMEGWLLHAAALNGKPFRQFTLGGSGLPAYGRSTGQRLVPGLPPPAGAGVSLLDAPPVPDQPRHGMLRFVLRGLAAFDDVRLEAVARWALTSTDRTIRLSALTALVQAHEQRRPWAIAASDAVQAGLRDPWCRVRAIAAGALLADATRPPPSSPASGPPDAAGVSQPGAALPAPDTLRAHWLIGQPRRDWGAVMALRDAATPAMQAALADDDHVVRREAAQVLARRYGEHLQGEQREAAPSPPAIDGAGDGGPGWLAASSTRATDTPHPGRLRSQSSPARSQPTARESHQ